MENEAAPAEVLIWPASPMIIPNAAAAAASAADSWRLSALRLDFLLSCSRLRLIYSGGDQQQLVWLFICLSRACKQSLMNLEREYIDASVGDKFCIKTGRGALAHCCPGCFSAPRNLKVSNAAVKMVSSEPAPGWDLTGLRAA